MSSIIDNSQDNLLVTHVNKLLDNSEFSRMAVGFFYLSGFEAIREKLNKVKKLRLIIGARTNQDTLEELVKGHVSKELTERELRAQRLKNKDQNTRVLTITQNEYSEDLSLMEQNDQNENGLAALWELISDGRIDIRVYTKGTLHSKAYLFDLPEKDYLEGIAIVGSSNLSISGMSNNSELNIKVTNPNDYAEIKTWFDHLWDESAVFSDTFMQLIQESWFRKQVTPYEIYIKTLYNLVRDRIEIKEHSALTAFDIDQLYPFQKDAYNRALDILENQDNPQNGVFVSDVVGLGKSYIAIALISYYWSVNQKASLIVCPASLQPMWEDYKDQFHLRCRILSYSALMFKDGNEQYTLNEEPSYDGFGVVVIDESHNFRNPETQRYKVLAPYLQGKKVILLTATPQNNNIWDIYYQIKLFHQSDVTVLNVAPNNLKSYFQTHAQSPEKIAELLQNFLIRRTRKDIMNSPRYTEWVSQNKFPDRRLNTMEYSIDDIFKGNNKADTYDEIINKLFKEESKDRFHYSIYNLTGFLKKGLEKKKEYVGLSYLGELVRGLLKVLLFKRMESSVHAFHRSIRRMIKRHEFILKSINQGYIVTGEIEQLEYFLGLENDDDLDQQKIKRYEIADFEIDTLKSAIQEDVKALNDVLSLVDPVYTNSQMDVKFTTFVNDIVKKFKNEKILIFSEFSDTVNYLYENLQKTFPNIVMSRISSKSANSQEKASIIKRFSPQSQTMNRLASHDKEIQFLITTDVLSEGQNLQDCRVVVNYDFHWNPVRLIQRIGRVDRIGSHAELIEVFNFLPDRKIEQHLALQQRVQNRINEIQQIFGLDSKVLSQEEILNDKSVFAIYSDRKEAILDSDENIMTIYDHAEQLLQKLKHEKPSEYQRIISLRDGIRTACSGDKKGVFAYLSSGNLHRLYFNDEEKNIDSLGEVLNIIKATPDIPKPQLIQTNEHNRKLKSIYDTFREELKRRQKEVISQMITPEQKHFLEKLQGTFNLFSDNSHLQHKVDELYRLYSKEIPDYAKSQLRRLRRQNLPDESMIEALQNLVEAARIRTFQDREVEFEKMIVRTICSESFI